MRYWMTMLAEAQRHRLSALLPPRSELVVYDIGANDGELTVPLAANPVVADSLPVRVVAFEPQPAVRARLMARAAEAGLSVALWGTADLTAIPVALGDRDTMIDLRVYSDDTFSSFYERPSEELSRYELAETEVVQVRMRPLDDMVAGGLVPPPDLVKVDVEGAERAVLAGAVRTLSTSPPPVLMEFSCPNTRNAGYSRGELLDQLAAMGYDTVVGLFRNEDRSLYGSESFDDCRIWNIIAIDSATYPRLAETVASHRAPWNKETA